MDNEQIQNNEWQRNKYPVRKNMRLQGYDYSQNGVYFLTICVKDKQNLLWNDSLVGAACGRPLSAKHMLSEMGQIIDDEINRIDEIYETVRIDKYVIMPNHIHMIIELNEYIDLDGRPQAAPTISRIINQLKGSISKQIGYSIWQKLFHDHIVRNENEYHRIWRYIDTNPVKWQDDKYFV